LIVDEQRPSATSGVFVVQAVVGSRWLRIGLREGFRHREVFVRDHTSGSQLGDAVQVAARPTTNGKGEM